MQAILAGVSLDRLSPETVLALSHRIGNSAVAEMIARRTRGSELGACPVPAPLPEMEGAELSRGPAGLIAPVDFAGLPPLAGAGPAYEVAG